MIRGEQLLDQFDHFGNVARGPRNDVRTFAAERVKVFPKSINVDGGVFVDAFTGFLRLCDDAVFHVGNVHYVGDFVTFELQVTAQDVSRDGAAEAEPRKPRAASGTGKQPRPTHYKVICISMYTRDLEELEAKVAELKRRGWTKANKSQLIRLALSQIDIDKLPTPRQ